MRRLSMSNSSSPNATLISRAAWLSLAVALLAGCNNQAFETKLDDRLQEALRPAEDAPAVHAGRRLVGGPRRPPRRRRADLQEQAVRPRVGDQGLRRDRAARKRAADPLRGDSGAGADRRPPGDRNGPEDSELQRLPAAGSLAPGRAVPVGRDRRAGRLVGRRQDPRGVPPPGIQGPARPAAQRPGAARPDRRRARAGVLPGRGNGQGTDRGPAGRGFRGGAPVRGRACAS